MINAIRKLFFSNEGVVEPDHLDQGQREALIDLLLLATYSDSHEDQNETTTLEKTTERFNWQSDVSIDTYIEKSRSQAIEVSESNDSRKQFLENISVRLKDKEGRYRALRLCNVLLYSDATLIGSEVDFIQEVARVFELK